MHYQVEGGRQQITGTIQCPTATPGASSQSRTNSRRDLHAEPTELLEDLLFSLRKSPRVWDDAKIVLAGNERLEMRWRWGEGGREGGASEAGPGNQAVTTESTGQEERQ